MNTVLWAIVFGVGVLCIAGGVVIVINPAFYRKVVEIFTKGKLAYILPFSRTAFGIVFLIAATSCKKPGIIIALGLITCAAGVVMFTMGLAKLKGVLNWLKIRPDWCLRLMGILAVLLGVLIIHAAGLPGQ